MNFDNRIFATFTFSNRTNIVLFNIISLKTAFYTGYEILLKRDSSFLSVNVLSITISTRKSNIYTLFFRSVFLVLELEVRDFRSDVIQIWLRWSIY